MYFRAAGFFAALVLSASTAQIRDILEARGFPNPANIRMDHEAREAKLTFRDGTELHADEELTRAIFARQAEFPPPVERLSRRNMMFPSLRKKEECVVYCSGVTDAPVCGDDDNKDCTCLSMCMPSGCDDYCAPM